ncbi:TPA: hypothetical protein DIC39_03750 [Patescibacteria group bacterium]|nr:hypothetical protein [Patescibacteria group bacterium]HCU48137.1 hypothetical protein [Patescibacteria group bacterium]
MWPQSEVKRRILIGAAKRLGLRLYEGSKHTNVEQVSTGLKTQIPRHAKVKRETAKAIVVFFDKANGFFGKRGLPSLRYKF